MPVYLQLWNGWEVPLNVKDPWLKNLGKAALLAGAGADREFTAPEDCGTQGVAHERTAKGTVGFESAGRSSWSH